MWKLLYSVSKGVERVKDEGAIEPYKVKHFAEQCFRQLKSVHGYLKTTQKGLSLLLILCVTLRMLQSTWDANKQTSPFGCQ